MRANKIANYDSILQVLNEPGCPFCRFMKNYQAALLQDPSSGEIHHLCSFHTWGLAASQRATVAAGLFLKLLQDHSQASGDSACDICTLLRLEEDRRMREFISCIERKSVSQWLHGQAVLCQAHGEKLHHGVPPVAAALVHSIMEKYRCHLAEELSHLQQEHDPADAGWGTLGHAAEFLVSQRGLRP